MTTPFGPGKKNLFPSQFQTETGRTREVALKICWDLVKEQGWSAGKALEDGFDFWIAEPVSEHRILKPLPHRFFVKAQGTAAGSVLLTIGRKEPPEADSRDGLNLSVLKLKLGLALSKVAPKNGIFLSYRRSDSADVTGRIYDHLMAQYGRNVVFKDVDRIPPGTDFTQVLNEALGECKVVLAVIGPTWEQTLRRRPDPGADYVRLELESALDRELPVIPLFVGGVTSIAADGIPKSLHPLLRLQGLPVRPDPDFSKDIGSLARRVDALLGLG